MFGDRTKKPLPIAVRAVAVNSKTGGKLKLKNSLIRITRKYDEVVKIESQYMACHCSTVLIGNKVNVCQIDDEEGYTKTTVYLVSLCLAELL